MAGENWGRGAGLVTRFGTAGATYGGLSYADQSFNISGIYGVEAFDPAAQGAAEAVPKHIGGTDPKGGAQNAVGYENLKEVLRVTEDANNVVDSLRETGALPDNYVPKNTAMEAGWTYGKALGNYIPGAQIGGDVWENARGQLPIIEGRIWYEADIGLNNYMSRSNQMGSRLLYSSDGLMYITTDHYETFHFIGGY